METEFIERMFCAPCPKVIQLTSSFHPPIIEQEEPFLPSKGWEEMIRKVFEVDLLLCPSCGGQICIIAFIEEPKVIDRIIRHLNLTFIAKGPPRLIISTGNS